MDPQTFFKEIPSWPPDKIREFLRSRDHAGYNLVDVRQQEEYEDGHLPGTKLIPVGDLSSRMNELDRAKPTIMYCRSGNRSRVAAGMLIDRGFKDVFSMEGGILAWKGLVASGPPEAGMAYFSSGERPEKLIALAWTLEEGSRRFYAGVAGAAQDGEAVDLFQELATAEERHKSTLLKLYRETAGDEYASKSPEALIPDKPAGEIMEGGMRVDEALAWARGKDIADILDLSIALESNAFDLYIKMERAFEDRLSKQVFHALSEEERQHLNRMTLLIEKRA
jgi:rhodanese-related sulfurtransferase/rubrerythrin